MALDAALARMPRLTCRVYTWDQPGISLGLKQPAPAWLSSPAWAAAGCGAVERPTGGGIAFHGSDVSVAVVVPRAIPLSLREVMGLVCGSAVELCRSFGAEAVSLVDAEADQRVTLCLAETSPYAVMAGSRKIAGFALRRYPETWLVQGSVLVAGLPERLRRGLPDEVSGRLASRAIALDEAARRPIQPAEAAARWAGAWTEWWDAHLMDTLMRAGHAL